MIKKSVLMVVIPNAWRWMLTIVLWNKSEIMVDHLVSARDCALIGSLLHEFSRDSRKIRIRGWRVAGGGIGWIAGIVINLVGIRKEQRKRAEILPELQSLPGGTSI